VPPGEEDEEDFVYYVGVGYDEVVLERGYVDEAVYLAGCILVCGCADG